ncbi:hypothetical protein LTR51_001954 [Lithohypha guttulata]|nr:hypothetical protein LTR51_001954 [Lithohypha guttulata]
MTAAAAAALAQAKKRSSPTPSVLQSPNPQAEALGALMGLTQNVTSPAIQHPKPNAATTMSQPLAVVAANLQSGVEGSTSPDNNLLTSPATSVGTVGSILNVSGAGTSVTSPQPVEGAPKPTHDSVSPQDPGKSASYHTPFLTPQISDAARRGMSLPGSASRHDARSPSSSSERPHECPKCNRKFARGDALARHNKGPGGCAGRRSSIGSFGGDEEGEGDETMDGIVYGEPDTMEDEEGGARGTPVIRRQAPSGDDSIDSTANYRLPSTYPPIQGRPTGSSFPPPGYTSSNAPQPINQHPVGSRSSKLGPGPPVFAHNPMTESPKPISPAQRQNTGTMDSVGRNRSPSNPQYAPAYAPRGLSGSTSLAVPPHGPQLPPPHGLNPPDSRFTLASQAGPTHPPTQPIGPPTHMSGSGPLSSHSSSGHGFSAHGSAEGHHHKGAFPTNEERLWAVVRSLEQQMGGMRETIEALRAEVGTLRKTIDQQRT